MMAVIVDDGHFAVCALHGTEHLQPTIDAGEILQRLVDRCNVHTVLEADAENGLWSIDGLAVDAADGATQCPECGCAWKLKAAPEDAP